ncbi:hypothetical protein acsn021_38720 [Anaerocolumna cellulosilytica]|uniref:Uncharacterized protein n=1 Tax=Anaerocolumna cellulosilytica TaxID=433286 RepID=A0A6S6QYK7_9FIRM|nr:hypothetical protein acsn021_38720 [Anaerocolumna cellulosilytica]
MVLDENTKNVKAKAAVKASDNNSNFVCFNSCINCFCRDNQGSNEADSRPDNTGKQE